MVIDGNIRQVSVITQVESVGSRLVQRSHQKKFPHVALYLYFFFLKYQLYILHVLLQDGDLLSCFSFVFVHIKSNLPDKKKH